jgi:2',3'-cyclic-nucleotide 2'-phosphodiesterase (5'-nucleotidase family)
MMLRRIPALLTATLGTLALLAVLALAIQPTAAQPLPALAAVADVPIERPAAPQALNLTPTNAISLTVLGTYATNAYSTARSAAEIVDYDPVSQTLYIVNNYSYTLDIVSIANPSAPTLVTAVPLSPTYGANPNSAAVYNGLIAVAVEAVSKTQPGQVVFFDRAGNYLNDVTVGSLPDMVTFTPNGRYLLVANEGEPNENYTIDPEGSISVIDLSGGVMSASVTTLGFTHINTATLDPRVRVFGPNATLAQDLEPEYIAVAPDSSKAWVALQEANALGVIDLKTLTVTQIVPLGFKDHALAGNAFDGSDRDGPGSGGSSQGAISITNWPVWGMYQPDGLALYQAAGKQYLVSANEGDTRDYGAAYNEEARVSTLTFDPSFPNSATLKTEDAIGRLTISKASHNFTTTYTADPDLDGDIDRLFVPGGRSFSIWSITGTLLFDSGDALERIISDTVPAWFNSDATGGFDTRSDNKGPEPETVALGAINNRQYAFIGLERIGGVMAFDVTDPAAVTFAQWVNNRVYTTTLSPAAKDLGPEGLKFIPANKSPNGKPLLIVANEVSGSTTVYEISYHTPFNLTIMHTNDFHARVDQYQNSGAYCPITGTGCIAGSARLATKINELRAANDHSLLVDAGDQFQGTLYYIQYKSDILTRTMNALGYQAMAVGNHEFDDGPAELRTFIDGVTFPVLSANLDASNEPLLAGKIKPSTVITVGGQPIGIVGLTTFDLPALSSPGPNITVTAELTALQAAVNDLQAQGIDKIVGLTHIGYDVDLSLAQVITGVDVIIGGHSHSFLYTPITTTNGDTAVGLYPTVVTAADGNPVLVATAYQWGRYLGNLNVTFSPTGTVASYGGNPIFMANSIPQDPVVQGIISPTYNVPLETLRNTVIATSTGPMSLTVNARLHCREKECELGNFVAEAMLWRVNAAQPITDQYELAIQNGGGLRAPIDQGSVTVGEVMELLPFGNAIATFELTGTHVITALENGVSQLPTLAGRFPQVAGLRYKFDPTRPVNSRIISVTVKNKVTGVYEPLNPARVYRLVSNDFMRRGGDGYTVFRDFAINPYDFGPALDQAAMDYLMSFPNATYTPFIDGRILQQGYARLAVAHLAPFANTPAGTSVTVTLDSTPVLTNIVYGASTGYITVTDGAHLVQIYPAGSASPAISSSVVLSANQSYSAIAIGDGANQPLSLLALLDTTAPISGSARVRIGHLAPFADTITDTLADVRLQDGTLLLGDVPFGAAAPYLTLPAGTYDLKITAPGGSPTLIDPLPVALNSNAILSVFATGDGAQQPLGAFAWTSTQVGSFLPLGAQLAVAHLAPFASTLAGTSVTITLNSTPVLTDFVYGESTGYLVVPEGPNRVDVYVGSSLAPFHTVTVTLPQAESNSLIARGDGINFAVDIVRGIDDTVPVSGSAKIRLGHLAPFTNTIAGSWADVRLQDGTLLLGNMPFGSLAPYLTLPAGTYDLKITAPGGYPTLIDPLPVTLNSNDILSVFATGNGTLQPLGAFAWTSTQPGSFLPLGAQLAVAHLAPFANTLAGTSVTVTLNATPVLTDFIYGESTGYLPVPEGANLVEIFPAGSASPAITASVNLTQALSYSAIAIGDGANQPLSLLALLDDTMPISGSARVRIGHLAPFAAGSATADVRLQDGTAILTNVVFSQVAPYLTLAAGTYDLKITAPGGAPTLIDPLPVTLNSNDVLSVFAAGNGTLQKLGAFAWPGNQAGFFLPLLKFIYLPLITR